MLKLLTLALALALPGCSTIQSHIPDVCVQGQPTSRNCFSAQGTMTDWRIGPFTLVDIKIK